MKDPVSTLKSVQPRWRVGNPQTPRLDAGPQTRRLDAGVQTPRLDFGSSKVAEVELADQPEEKAQPPVDESVGGSSSHPWKTGVTADGTVKVVGDSLFFEDLYSLTEVAVGGYSLDDGAEFAGAAAGQYLFLELSLNASLEISDPTLDIGDLPGDDGNGLYTLSDPDDPPQYATAQYIPIAKFFGEGDGLGVRQLIRNHIRLGIVAVDGVLLYHPF